MAEKSSTNTQIFKEADFVSVVGALFSSIKQCWEALKLNLATFIMIILLPILIILAMFAIAGVSVIATRDQAVDDVTMAALFVPSVIAVLAFLVLLPAIIYTEIESIQGKKVSVSEALSKGFSLAFPFLVLIILSAIVIMAGFILLIIPGIITCFFLIMAPYYLVGKQLSAIDAMKQSYKVTQKYWKIVLAFIIVSAVVSAVGYVPVIGWLISLMLSVAYFCLQAYVYAVMDGKKILSVK